MSERLIPTALHYVDQVARSGSIQKASRELGIAASAINRQVLMLEADLGVALFERLPRGMRPTPAGEAVVRLGRRWRQDLQSLAAELKHLTGTVHGQVRIAAMDSHATSFLPAFIERIAQEHPSLALNIEITSTDQAMALLMASEVDVVAAFNLPPHRDARTISSDALPFGCAVAADHPLARHQSVTLQKAARYPIALQSRALMIRRYLDAKHGWLLAKGDQSVVTNSLHLVKMLARSGRYIALTSELDVASELLDGSLVFIPVSDAGAEPQSISVAVGARNLTRNAQLVADMLSAEIRRCLARIRVKADDMQPAAQR
ncbi:MAG: LysR family transcriptional regulator [Beijerinckiaceae bacterium]|nr:LysR family transcriptional regulator [Beijerinckiaceae bacterium]